MTRPLWPLALALWLGTGPAMAQPVAPGGGDRAVAPRAAGQDVGARAGGVRTRIGGMSPEERAAARAARRGQGGARLAAAHGDADPLTPTP